MGIHLRAIKIEPIPAGHKGDVTVVGYTPGNHRAIDPSEESVVCNDDSNLEELGEGYSISYGTHYGFIRDICHALSEAGIDTADFDPIAQMGCEGFIGLKASRKIVELFDKPTCDIICAYFRQYDDPEDNEPVSEFYVNCFTSMVRVANLVTEKDHYLEFC